MSALWRIAFFGGLKACQTGQEFFRFRTQKAGALLALLAYPPHQMHSRDKLIEQFWPDTDLDPARHLLSQALFSLRHRLEPPGISPGSLILADHARIWLNPVAFTTDMDDFSDALQSARQTTDPSERIRYLQQAIALYNGALLPGFYEEWALIERERWQYVFSSALRQGAADLQQRGQMEMALEFLLRAVAADPQGTDAREELVRLYVAQGRRAEALRQYRLLAGQLDCAGQEPSEALRLLIRRLYSARNARAVGSARSSYTFRQ